VLDESGEIIPTGPGASKPQAWIKWIMNIGYKYRI
jgi:hypothetical protein